MDIRTYLMQLLMTVVLTPFVPFVAAAAVATYGVGEAPQTVTVGDLNGDNFPELVTANLADGTLSILFNKGASEPGDFVEPFTPIGVGPVRDVAIAEMTGDGIPDIVTETENVDGAVLVFPGIGDGTFFSAIETSFGHHGLTSLEVLDLNNDGKLDVVVGFIADDEVRVLLGNGNGTFQAPTIQPAQDFSGIFDVPQSINADLNQDGIPDTATVNTSANTVTVVLNGNHPTSKEQCKDDGYTLYLDENDEPFKNQGQCIQYVAQS